MNPHLETVRRYFAAIETDGELNTAFFTPDARFVQLPNKLFPAGLTRDLAESRDAFAKSKGMVANQRYQVRRALADGDGVAMEVAWSAELKIPMGNLAAGSTMKASFGVFFTFRGGLICEQRNYDCFEPF